MKVEYMIREGIIHIRKMVRLLKQRGPMFAIRLLLTLVFGYYFYRIFKSARIFFFQKAKHKYFYHHYNVTWTSERAVEIPIVRGFLAKRTNKRILEFGNVLSHYIATYHEVVDKHEKGRNVINQDVIDFRPEEKYDVIISISTLEHVGWDEHLLYHGPEPHKIIKAFDNLTRLLKRNGEMMITFPVGYNPILDQLVDSGRIRFTELLCMKRVTADNAWIESHWCDIRETQYDNPFISANGLVIGYFKSNSNHSTGLRT